ncbi:MAG: ABC transporter permease [Chloroflexi bacterium]|nr:ABC transporter permease [Chloroflexota bacterium]
MATERTPALQVDGPYRQALGASRGGRATAGTAVVQALGNNPVLLLGSVLLVVIVLSGIFASSVSPYDPNKVFPGRSLERPGEQFWLGTDQIGRDVLSRVIHGSRVSFVVVFPAVGFALTWGVILGLVAGYFGRWIDQLITRVLDVFFAFPALLLAIALVSALGPSVQNLILVIGIVYTPGMARVARGPVLAVKETEFVTAARTIGAGHVRVLVRHILPNILSPIIVETALALSRGILIETALSFLGLGAPPPNPTWGSMLAQSRQFMEFAPWTAVAPGVAIMLAAMSFVLIGNGLRDLLDPRRRNR